MATKTTKNGVPRGGAPRGGQGPAMVAGFVQRRGTKEPEPPGAEIIKRRHPDWEVNQIRWRWLLDSYEGGQRYREATYGPDRRGLPLRNLIRHKREYPDPLEYPNTYQGYGLFAGSAGALAHQTGVGPFPGQLGAFPGATAMDDDFEYRRARTPVPEFVAETIEIHLGKIYDQEIAREGPDELKRWWRNPSGTGRDMDEWMREDVAPLLQALGQIDICFDYPQAPPGVKIDTKRDEEDYGLNWVCASIILPENMVWWRNDPAGNFLECLIREYADSADHEIRDAGDEEMANEAAEAVGAPDDRAQQRQRFRHWTATTVALYDDRGYYIEEPREHGYGFVPIIREVDLRRHRTPMIGKSRNEAIAEYQQEYYNRDSELILSDTLQAHPMLSGPSQLAASDKTMSVGPQNVLVKYYDEAAHSYEGWEFVSPPKDPAESLRRNKQDIVDMKDRRACLTKPAGVHGTTGGTVSQSGYSKAMDEHSGSKVLSAVAKVLARAEKRISEMALMVMLRRRLTFAERETIKVVYPTRFTLQSAEAILLQLGQLTSILAMESAVEGGADPQQGGPASSPQTDASQSGGNPSQFNTTVITPVQPGRRYLVPTLIAEVMMQLTRALLIGADDATIQQIERETEAFLALHALPDVGTKSGDEALGGQGSEEQDAQEDRTGVSGGTMVSNNIPVVN